MNNRIGLKPIAVDPDSEWHSDGERERFEEAMADKRSAARVQADLADAVHKDLADEIPADTTAITGDKVALERVLEKRRAHKRELQKLLSVTKAKLRQLDGSIKGIEDHLGTLFESEV